MYNFFGGVHTAAVNAARSSRSNEGHRTTFWCRQKQLNIARTDPDHVPNLDHRKYLPGGQTVAEAVHAKHVRGLNCECCSTSASWCHVHRKRTAWANSGVDKTVYVPFINTCVLITAQNLVLVGNLGDTPQQPIEATGRAPEGRKQATGCPNYHEPCPGLPLLSACTTE